MRIILLACAIAITAAATAASAAPGLGSAVYGARVEAGEVELESRYGELSGGADDGEAVLVLEAARGFSDRFYGAVLAEIEREPGGDPEFEAVAVEAIWRVETFGGVDVAVYGEYEATLKAAADRIELKALFQKTAGPFDARLNVILERSLESGADVELGYAASASWEVAHDVRLGLMAFGEAGDFGSLGGRRDHFLGPVARFELDEIPGGGELEIEAGYLFALGAARDDADGQFRLTLAWEKKF